MRAWLGLLLLLVLAPGAAAAGVTVKSGKARTTRLCAHTRHVHVFAPRKGARLVNPAARGRLVVDTCEDGQWIDTVRLARDHAILREPVGDYRVRVPGAGVAPAYLRYGVGEMVDAPFTVTVFNRNRSVASCASDDAPFPLLGHLTAPRAALDRKAPSVTLLLHGLGYGEFFWNLGVGGYNTARHLALDGHAVVTIDRPNYGGSKTKGEGGNATCVGSQADMADQVVQALKAGSYNVFGTRRLKFARVALVGHSLGGLIAELAAASFPGIDALGVISYADQGQSPLALVDLTQQSAACLFGGAGNRPGYAPFGATDADFTAANLNAPTDPRVVRRLLARRTRDPCGDVTSAAGALAAASVASAKITGPVLVMGGASDALFGPAAMELQQAKYPLAKVTFAEVPNAGHAIFQGYSAPAARQAFEAWLSASGF